MNPRCLACRSTKHHPLYRWDEVPLSVVGLPHSSDEAKAMAALTMNVRRCAMCGHVFHTDFDYEKVPYKTGSNLVYNRAKSWGHYQRELAHEWITRYSLSGKTILEIGAGDGTFLVPFLEAGATCIAFEPGPDADTLAARGVTVHREVFSADRLKSVRPDAIVCRHVMEHLDDPLDFLESIALATDSFDVAPLFLGEVPQIDKAIAEIRINDFLYEHVSNFTSRSFRTLFERAGYAVSEHASRYHDEVVTCVARPVDGGTRRSIRGESEAFLSRVDSGIARVREQIASLARHGVALWGGTGKGAALITMYGLGPDLCPTVVDSDPRKVGAYVPGTGQKIESPDVLVKHPVDSIVLCTQWRARDIEREAREVWGLTSDLYVVSKGDLVPLTAELRL